MADDMPSMTAVRPYLLCLWCLLLQLRLSRRAPNAPSRSVRRARTALADSPGLLPSALPTDFRPTRGACPPVGPERRARGSCQRTPQRARQVGCTDTPTAWAVPVGPLRGLVGHGAARRVSPADVSARYISTIGIRLPSGKSGCHTGLRSLIHHRGSVPIEPNVAPRSFWSCVVCARAELHGEPSGTYARPRPGCSAAGPRPPESPHSGEQDVNCHLQAHRPPAEE